MPAYDLTIRVEGEDKLATIISALKGSATLISMTVVEEKKPKTRNHGYVDGKRNKGISGEDLVIQSLKAGAQTSEQLTATFVERGFAPKSVSPNVSALVHRGIVVKNGHGFVLKGGA
jgi:hypothetical protein